VILDKSPAIGALARTEVIANYPGSEAREMNGLKLLDQMREQAIHYGTDYRKAQVFAVEAGEHNKVVYTPDVTVKARTLVLATGAMGREPYFAGEDEYLGKGVSYCATCDAPFYNDAEVAVVGVNPEAMEEAEHLTKFAKVVHWITQSDLPEGNADAEHLLSLPNVKQWPRTTMKSIEGDDSGVTGVVLEKRPSGDIEKLELGGVFVYISGSKPITDFLEDCEVALDDEGGVSTDENMMTNVGGVFAIGDIRNTPFKQAVVAASDGCIAAMAIDRYLKGRKKIKVDWKHQ
jgi:thioredoxin reductase (NADPH)